MGAVADGEYLKRSGANLIGAVAGGVGSGTIHSWQTREDANFDKAAALAHTWYNYEAWGLFGETQLGYDPTSLSAVLRVDRLTGGTWNVRVRDATNNLTLAEWTGIAATGVYLHSTTTPASWPVASTADIQIQYEQTIGVVGADDIGLSTLHIFTSGTEILAQGGFLAPLPMLGLAA